MQAFLVTIAHLYQINDKTVPPGESQVMYDKDWGYVLRSEPQTLQQSVNFHRCHSTSTFQQARSKLERGKLEFM